MKTKLILVIAFGLFIALLAMNDLPQSMVHYGVTPGYAMGPNPGKTDPDRFRRRPGHNPISVPEPSSLMLIGGGAAGVGIYLFIKNRNKKK